MRKIPWWPFKIIGGAVTLGLIYKLTPIWEILQLFVVIVCIPLMGLVALGWITDGTYTAITSFFPRFIKDLEERVNHHSEILEEPS